MDKKTFENVPVRKPLPDERSSTTIKAIIGGRSVYLILGEYDDGTLGEIFIRVGKEGSLDRVHYLSATAMSIALQFGVPLEVFVDKFENISNETGGITSDKDFPIVKSIIDWVAKVIRKRYLRDIDR